MAQTHITQTTLLYTKEPYRKVYVVSGKVANNQEDTRNKPAATDQIPSAEIIHLRKVQITMFIKSINGQGLRENTGDKAQGTPF